MKTTLFERIRHQPKKTLIGFGVFCLLLVATIIALLFPPQALSSVDQFRVEWINALSIESGTNAVQSFKATDNFSGFGLLFADSEQVLDQGGVKIEIYSQQELTDTCYVEAKNY